MDIFKTPDASLLPTTGVRIPYSKNPNPHHHFERKTDSDQTEDTSTMEEEDKSNGLEETAASDPNNENDQKVRERYCRSRN